MPTITLTLPVAGQDVDAGPMATNFADLQALLNGNLDQSNISASSVMTFASAVLTAAEGLTLSGNGGKDTLNLSNTTADVGITIGGDTNLYRSAANTLRTDDAFQSADVMSATNGYLVTGASGLFVARQQTAGNIIFATRATGQAADRFQINNHGTMVWGDGTAASDTNLYRGGTNILKTDDSLIVAPTATTGEIMLTSWGAGSDIDTLLPGSTAGAAIVGPLNSHMVFTVRDNDAGDGWYFVHGGGNYNTDSIYDSVALAINVQNFVGIGHASPTSRLHLPAGTTAAEGIAFGSDTNLYRLTTDCLRTDDQFRIHRAGVAGTEIAFSLKAAAEADLRFQVNSNGQIYWGDGTATTDTTLYRSAADVLKTDDTLLINARAVAAGNASAIQVFAAAEAQPRLIIGNGGTLTWGDGSAVGDTNLYRSAADELKTDDRLISVLGVSVPATSNASYRGAQIAGNIVLGNVLLTADANYAFRIRGNGMIEWGAGGASAVDTTLYRSAADTLKTDGALVVDGTLSVGDQATITRAAAGTGALAFYVGVEANPKFKATPTATGTTFEWGAGGATALDTNLYRSAADTLKTDDTLLFTSPGCRVSHSSAISIPNATTTEITTLNTEHFDDGGLHSTVSNTGRITIVEAGKYQVTVNVNWVANVTGLRQVELRRYNSGGVIQESYVDTVSAAVSGQHGLSIVSKASATDYFSIWVSQTSGAALDIAALGCQFMAVKVG